MKINEIISGEEKSLIFDAGADRRFFRGIHTGCQ